VKRFGDRVLRKIQDIRKSNRRLEKVHNEEVRNICSFPNMSSAIRSRRVAKVEIHTKLLPKKKPLEKYGIDGRIILKLVE
jgi:hypothetical protein